MIFFLLTIGLTFSSWSYASAEDYLVDLLRSINVLSATYEHENRQEIHRGQFWVSRPDRFRLVAFEPLSQTIVSDGQNLWTYDSDLEQVIVASLKSETKNIPLLLFASDPEELNNVYDIEYFEDEDLQHFLLSPIETKGVIGNILLSFENKLPRRLVLQMAAEQHTTISFHSVSVASVDDNMFVFQIPQNVDVIDDRVLAE